MTPWTALLESLHSALIDELTERHPEPKPTLGLPIRQPKLVLPQTARDLLAVEFCFEGERGFALLATSSGFIKELQLTPESFWQAILKRAGSEFMRRQIRPVAGAMRGFQEGDAPPVGWINPTRVVWIPFQIPSGTCFLGLGVE